MNATSPLALDSATLTRQIHALPSLPTVVLDLINQVNQGDRIDTIADTLSLDQALSAKVLQLANSPFYGLSGRVGSIRDGINVLGLNQLGCLVVAAAVTLQFAQLHGQSLKMDSFWRHNIACAVAARQLAQMQGLDAATAFTAGLLHDVGRLVADSLYPEEMARAVAWASRYDQPHCEAEQHLLGICHAELGARVCEHWHFRDDIVDAIAHHHQPGTGPGTSPSHPLRDVVHVADAIAHALDLTGDPDEAIPPINERVWERLALDEQRIVALLGSIEREFQELDVVLRTSRETP